MVKKLAWPSMSGAMGMVGQMAEYTAKKTIHRSMLPHTARWENYNEEKGREKREGGRGGEVEIKRQNRETA